FYDMFTGGAFERATIFALGIMPYISASIIIQLLVVVVPALEKLQKEGAEGQKKITEYTRYGTIGLCIIQSVAMAAFLAGMNSPGSTPIVTNSNWWFYVMCVLTFTTGTAFIMWVGEQISEHGIGNGISMIIFTSIVADMPNATRSVVELIKSQQLGLIQVGILMVLIIAIIAGVIVVTTGVRRVPVQYPRQMKGRRMTTGGRNYLPLRVNQAGVIPIIFASSLLMLPGMLAQVIQNPTFESVYITYFRDNRYVYDGMYAGLIIFFSFFYTAITFNPIEMAENMKKYGGVIMGVRPGKATAEYLNRVMTRITLVGSLFLAAVALLPEIFYGYVHAIPPVVARFFGGTSLLILVGVALDTVRQIETHLTMRNYDGFVKGRRVRSRRMS
ncbi:MAG: preprotein translocase subunit SecY, partial [Candidatus Hydrogenedentes bacterium]|nr:preprotein translocase subunit SecY [Candidatus Hydrogenedentota bacterium]